jgi:hypothetical protein
MTALSQLGTVLGQLFMQRALVSRHFGSYLVLSSVIGGGCAVLGLRGSGLTNLPSGPCVVIVQFFGFLLALAVSLGRRRPQHRRGHRDAGAADHSPAPQNLQWRASGSCPVLRHAAHTAAVF